MEFNEIVKGFIPYKEFIKRHTHVEYCECFINSKGEVSYAVPSHEQMLLDDLNIKVSDILEGKIEEPDFEDMLRELGYLSCWTSRIKGNITTNEQLEAYNALRYNKLLTCVNNLTYAGGLST